MDKVVFNVHDVILLMTFCLCCVLAFLYLITQQSVRKSTPLLVGFMLAHGFIALHELSYYGQQFRYEILHLNPNLFFIGSFAYCVDAVLLCFFTKAVVYEDFSFKQRQLWHLLPIPVYALYLIAEFYSKSLPQQLSIIWNWQLTNSWHYVSVELAIKLLRIVYAVYCLNLIARYSDLKMNQSADLAKIEINWLKTLVIGFVAVFSIEGVLGAVKVLTLFYPIDIKYHSQLGVSVYYATFVLLVSLLIYSVAKLPFLEQVKQNDDQDDTTTNLEDNGVDRIKRYMEVNKPYLNAQITLPELAEDLCIPTKILSMTLNHHFQMNFYEFINSYRIEEAKRIMLASDEMSITEVYYAVGFNSKSVFYAFFRKSENMTPASYRKKYAVV